MKYKNTQFISALCILSILVLSFFSVPFAYSENLTSRIQVVHQNMLTVAKMDPAIANLYNQLGYPLKRLEAIKVAPLTDGQICRVVKEAAQDIKSVTEDINQNEALKHMAAIAVANGMVIIAGLISDGYFAEKNKAKKEKVNNYLNQNKRQQGALQAASEITQKSQENNPHVQKYLEKRSKRLDECHVNLISNRFEFENRINIWNRILPKLKQYRRLGALLAINLSYIYINCESLQFCNAEEAQRLEDQKVLDTVTDRILKRVNDQGAELNDTIQFLMVMGKEMQPHSSRLSSVPVKRYEKYPFLLLEDVDDGQVSLGDACTYAVTFPELRTKFELFSMLKKEEFSRGVK